MNSVILIGCFTPLVLIFLVMKLSVWVSAVNSENTYVRKAGLARKGKKRPDLTQRNLERDYSSQRKGSDGKFINTTSIE